MTTTQIKILADATINNIVSSTSPSCDVNISNIQEYTNTTNLPKYLYVTVDYSDEIATPDHRGFLNKYDRNISLITNSAARDNRIVGPNNQIPEDYKNFYGVYKLVPFIEGKGSYYVKVYSTSEYIGSYRINILLMYNGASWVFYIGFQSVYKDFVYVNMLIKNDIVNYTTTDFYYIDENKKIIKNKNNYIISFNNVLPSGIISSLHPLDGLITGKIISNPFNSLLLSLLASHLDANTTKLIIPSQLKITADARINDDCSNIKITNIQEYSSESKLPEYLYVIVDYSKDILENYDPNIKLITNSSDIIFNNGGLRNFNITNITTSEFITYADNFVNAVEDSGREPVVISKSKYDLLDKNLKLEVFPYIPGITELKSNVDNLKRSLETYKSKRKSGDFNLIRTRLKIVKNSFKQFLKCNVNYYKNFYGVYKLIPHIDGKGSYYTKVYNANDRSDRTKINILLVYNGSSWVFYVQTEKEYKDFLYVNMFLKNDIKNYITTEFSYIASDNSIQKNMKNEYKIFFVTELPSTLTESLFPHKDRLVIGDTNIIPTGRLTANTSELITI